MQGRPFVMKIGGQVGVEDDDWRIDARCNLLLKKGGQILRKMGWIELYRHLRPADPMQSGNSLAQRGQSPGLIPPDKGRQRLFVLYGCQRKRSTIAPDTRKDGRRTVL